ncbi:hypothetical protein KR51_00026570 [Rubidibacter lacunae KORDI 51-2]|uniref:Uncharacterized protein n=1 Tax=Rubidibacter lacunae KORDI 51-2 TaxID=582515 RepID=U5D7T3_9CHRO|nr:hypothetical protein [Rubidibacter lacunae]ERN40673.1 hypothetical protein KR51_00026570 [Rubidibacter lacunae KORDI 51-2]
MPSTSFTESQPTARERVVWESLKQAISSSSGFTCWQAEQGLSAPATCADLDERVRAYLRETLATLAY